MELIHSIISRFLRYKQKILILLAVAGISTIVTSPTIVSQFFYRPSNHVFVGLPIYFEDYYYYLDQFFQGAHGGWMTVNRFNSENIAPTFIYVTNILLGKVGGLFGLSAYVSYMLFSIAEKFLFFLTAFFLIRNERKKTFWIVIATLLIFIYSTGFPQIQITHQKINIDQAVVLYRTANRIIARFGSSPSAMVTNILFCLGILFLFEWNKRVAAQANKLVIELLLCFCIFYLSLCDITISFELFATSIICIIWQCIQEKRSYQLTNYAGFFIMLLVSFIPVSSYIISTVSADPAYRLANQWDVNQYYLDFRLHRWSDYIFAFGTLGIFFCIGLPVFFRSIKRFNQKIIFTIIVIGFGGYFGVYFLHINFPGFRFLFAPTYICLAIVGIEGLYLISRRIILRHSLLFIILLYISFNIFTYYKTIEGVVTPLQEPYYHFAYVPDHVFSALMYLKDSKPADAVVLANPHTSIDLMIPGLTGKKTYTGHSLMTLNSAKKDADTNSFFAAWVESDSWREFMKKNNIRYVLCTQYDLPAYKLHERFPSLRIAYQNNAATVFRYDP